MAYDGTIKIDTSIDSSGVKKGVSGITSSIKSIAGALGIVKVVGSAFTMLKNSIQSAFDRSDTMEQFDRTMTAITGDSKAAGVALEELKGITKGTAYGLDIAAKATQNFVTRGLDIGDATKRVGIWADAVSFYGKGTNEELQTVTDALAKMSTKGKVEMEQLNRLFDVGIDAVGMYAKATGRSSAQVQDDLSYGRISAEEFISVVSSAMETGAGGVQKVAGAAKEAGTSWKGTMDNMKAACTRGMLGIIESIDNGLNSINLPTIRESIAGFGSFMETTLGKLGNAIKGLIREFGPSIANVVQIFKSAFTKIPIAFKPIVKTVKEFIQDILKSFTSGGLKTAVYTLSNIISSLGNIINKVAKVVLPILSKAINTIGKNLHVLVPLLVAAVVAFKGWSIVQKVKSYMKALTTTISAVNAATKATVVSTLSSTAATTKEAAANTAATAAIGIKQLALGVLTGKIGIATAAQWLWNTAMAANPIGLVITALGALAAVIGVVVAMQQSATTEAERYNQVQQDTLSQIQEEKKAYEDKKAQQEQSAATNLVEAANAERLWSELKNLVDANGNVTEANKGRVQFILDQLNPALGTELSLVDNQIQGYSELSTSIDGMIEKKKAQILLESQEELYKEALLNLENKQIEQAQKAIEMAEQEQKIKSINAQIEEQRALLGTARTEGEINAINLRIQKLQEELGVEQNSLSTMQQAYSENESLLQGYYSDINSYETASQQILEGNTAAAVQTLQKKDDAFVTAASVVAKSADEQRRVLQQQVIDTETNARLMRERYNAGVEGVTEDMVRIAEEQAEKSKIEFEKIGGNMSDGIGKGVEGKSNTVTSSISGVIGRAVEAAKNLLDIHSPSRLMRKEIGQQMGAGLSLGIEDEQSSILQSIRSVLTETVDYAKDIVNSNRKQIPFPLAASMDLSGINPSAIVSQMQAAVAVSQSRIMTNVSATAYTNMISKLDSLNFVKEIKSACKEGCESASLQAEVTGKVVMGQRQVGTLVAPYVSEELGKGDVYD